MNRISPVLDRLIGIEDPSELVTELEEVISDSVSAPEAGQFFVFWGPPKGSLPWGSVFYCLVLLL